MKHLKLFENQNNISVNDILKYSEMRNIINKSAKKYFELHKHELDDEDFDVANMRLDYVYITDSKVIIQIKSLDFDVYEDFELSIEDFVRFCNDPDAYMDAKKYNL